MKEVTDGDFRAQVLEADGPVIVYVWAPCSRSCRMMDPVFRELANEYAGTAFYKELSGKHTGATFYRLNADEHSEAATKCDVVAIPTIVVFEGGLERHKAIGTMSLERLIDEFAPWLVE